MINPYIDPETLLIMKLDHTCPICKIVFCENKTEAFKFFGFRVIGGKDRVQSYCRACRINSVQKMRKIKNPHGKLFGTDLRTIKGKLQKKRNEAHDKNMRKIVAASKKKYKSQEARIKAAKC